MSVRVENIKQFSRVFDELAKHSSRTVAEQINFRMLDIGFLAQKLTVKADKRRINSDLRSPRFYTAKTKTGKRRVRRTTRARSIIQGRAIKKGKPLAQKALTAKANMMIAERKRAVGFAKAGWNKPIRDVQAALIRMGKFFKTRPKLRSDMKNPGFGIGARNSRLAKFVAELNYHIGVVRGKKVTLDRRTVKAANVAVRLVSRKMAQRLARKLDLTFAQVNRRVLRG